MTGQRSPLGHRCALGERKEPLHHNKVSSRPALARHYIPHNGYFLLECIASLLVREGDRFVQDFDCHFLSTALASNYLSERAAADHLKTVDLIWSNLWRSFRDVLSKESHS